jgi:hypothetical protein
MGFRDSTIGWWIKFYYSQFVFWCYEDSNGIYLLAIMVFWVFAAIFAIRIYHKAKYREYIGIDIFETNRVPLYFELMKVKEREKQANQAKLDKAAKEMYEVELQHTERKMKQQDRLNQRLVEDEGLYELRHGKRMPVRVRFRNWFRRAFNDDAIKGYIRPTKEVKLTETTTLLVDETPVSAWDKYPPQPSDLNMEETNIYVNKIELDILKSLRRNKDD